MAHNITRWTSVQTVTGDPTVMWRVPPLSAASVPRATTVSPEWTGPIQTTQPPTAPTLRHVHSLEVTQVEGDFYTYFIHKLWPDLGLKWGRLAPNGTNSGLFQIRYWYILVKIFWHPCRESFHYRGIWLGRYWTSLAQKRANFYISLNEVCSM